MCTLCARDSLFVKRTGAPGAASRLRGVNCSPSWSMVASARTGSTGSSGTSVTTDGTRPTAGAARP